jgi:hypothetical protein
VETSASFEARYAPLSYPTEGGDTRWCHGRPKRARSWKRRTQPRKTYSLTGLLYSERGDFTSTMPHYGYPLWLLARSDTSPGNCGPKIDAACEVRLNLTPLSGQASGVVSSLSESECLLPLWTKSPAGGGVQDCLWKTFSRIFATMPELLFRLTPIFCPSLDVDSGNTVAATASGSSSATSSCLVDVALGFIVRSEIMSGVVHLCPSFG